MCSRENVTNAILATWVFGERKKGEIFNFHYHSSQKQVAGVQISLREIAGTLQQYFSYLQKPDCPHKEGPQQRDKTGESCEKGLICKAENLVSEHHTGYASD